MKNLKSVGQYFVALALAVVVSVISVMPAHAVDLSFSETFWSIPDWDDAKVYVTNYWRREYDFDNGVLLSRDVLDDLCASLNEVGFPCKVVPQSQPSGLLAYYIIGTGTVPVENVWGVSRELSIEYFVHTNFNGAVYYSEQDSSSSLLNSIDVRLRNIYNTLHDYIGDLIYLGFASLDEGIEVLNLRLQLLTGYISGFEDDPSTPSIMSKIDDLIASVENLSVIGGGGDVYFDTAPITTKLEQVASSIKSAIITANDTSALEDTIKSFQYDFDDTFSDLKHLLYYVTEILDFFSGFALISAVVVVNPFNHFKSNFKANFSFSCVHLLSFLPVWPVGQPFESTLSNCLHLQHLLVAVHAHNAHGLCGSHAVLAARAL